MAKLIVPDVDLARAALTYWPTTGDPTIGSDPTGWNARLMTCIALMETDGNQLASLVNGPGSELAWYADRGPFANNEGAIEYLLGYRPDPRLYADVNTSAEWARMVWDWRYNRARSRGLTTVGAAFVDAFKGWTTYKRAKSGLPDDTQYAAAWAVRWPRAGTAIKAALA